MRHNEDRPTVMIWVNK